MSTWCVMCCTRRASPPQICRTEDFIYVRLDVCSEAIVDTGARLCSHLHEHAPQLSVAVRRQPLSQRRLCVGFLLLLLLRLQGSRAGDGAHVEPASTHRKPQPSEPGLVEAFPRVLANPGPSKKHLTHPFELTCGTCARRGTAPPARSEARAGDAPHTSA
jgi:hypothetical protein